MAVGERVYSARAFAELARRDAARVFEPDATLNGGLMSCMEIADIAARSSIEVIPHIGGPTVVGLAANLQWATAARVRLFEFDIERDQPMITAIGDNPGLGAHRHPRRDPDRPLGAGLGVDVDESELAEHPYVEGETYAELFPEHESGRTAHAGSRDSGRMRTTSAAALFAESADWEVVELEVDPPRAGEVHVRFDYTGLCRSDEHLRFGSAGRLPIVGGHEGAGVVEEVGPGVDDLKPGDHVVGSIVPTCGRCRWCVTGSPYLCDLGAHALTGMSPDGSFPFHRGDEDMGGFCGLGAFSRYATVARGSLVPIPSDIPLDLACLLACCVPTGWGSAVNAARITPGDVVTIIGVGGVGSFAVQGALAAGASVVACIDPEPFKLQFAAKLGAHLCYQSYDEAAAALAEDDRGGDGGQGHRHGRERDRRCRGAGLRARPARAGSSW